MCGQHLLEPQDELLVKTKVSSWYSTKPTPPGMPAILGETTGSLFSLNPYCFGSSQGGVQPNRLLSKNRPSCGHHECIVNNHVLEKPCRFGSSEMGLAPGLVMRT